MYLHYYYYIIIGNRNRERVYLKIRKLTTDSEIVHSDSAKPHEELIASLQL